jgi:ABC-type oligopeptide transport system substrate-binding subunit
MLAGLLLAAAPVSAQKKTLVVALNQDPDIMDPSLARTYVGRIVFAHICEKLYEIDENLNVFYHRSYIVALPKSLKGYKAVPDGLIRMKGVTWN